jgi:hypothetical protein
LVEDHYFCICPEDGQIEWYELNEEEEHSLDPSRVNYLKSDGNIAYSNAYKRLKDKEYLDIVCRFCECPVILIPFSVCNLEDRKKVFKMTKEERIKYAERFELLDNLD